jgi:hypothetical protein
LSVEILVVGTLLAEKIFQDAFRQTQVLFFLASTPELFVDQPQVPNRDSRVFVVVVSVSFSEDFDRLVVVLDRLVVFFQTFLAVGQVRQALTHFDVEPPF